MDVQFVSRTLASCRQTRTPSDPNLMVCEHRGAVVSAAGPNCRRYGYPPDKQEKATQTVLKQAEVLSEIWAAA
jgi:hypothetical protein